jgi:phage-related protein
MYEVLFYTDKRGAEPVKEFIESLGSKTQQKILAALSNLAQEGPLLRRPYADKVRNSIYELRVRFASDNIRIFYFFYQRYKIILVHALRKNQNQLPENQILLAEKRMEAWCLLYA